MALLFSMAGILFILWKWIKDQNLRRLAVVLVSLSPSVFDYFIEGRSDVFAFFWLILSLYLLSLKKAFDCWIYFWSGRHEQANDLDSCAVLFYVSFLSQRSNAKVACGGQ